MAGDEQFTESSGPGVFAQFARAQRYRCGWTQDELAERSGVSAHTIRRIEAGTSRQIDPRILQQLCVALDVPTTHAAAILGYVDLGEIVIADYPASAARPGDPSRTLGEVEADLLRMRNNVSQPRLLRGLVQRLLDDIAEYRREQRAVGPTRPARLAEALGLGELPALSREQRRALDAAEAAAEAEADRIYAVEVMERNAA